MVVGRENNLQSFCLMT